MKYNYLKLRHQRLQHFLEIVDSRLISFINLNTFTFGVLSGLFLLVLGVLYRDWFLILKVLFTGFIGYELSFSVGLIFNIIASLLGSYSNFLKLPFPILQFVLCLHIAWVGYHHKKFAKMLKDQINESDQTQYVVSWTMINEVRNSFMAMRMMLFKQTKFSINEEDYKTIDEELLRLEGMFGNIIKSKNHTKNQKVNDDKKVSNY